MDQGGMLWLVINVMLVVVLAGAIAYGIGIWRKRRRDPAMERVRDNATKDLYKSNGDS